ncbi:sulfatase family protein [Stratiformator vulcanicus]|nr:sulfatase [Stratiformator vulcanicus]
MTSIRSLALLCVFSVSFTASADDRPNVILFIADDVSWNDFGCYGNDAARTPNIDSLASGGMRFTDFYLTASSCSPSRCSIITGRYPHNNGEASELHRPLPEYLVKFPKLLKEAGYYTALSGKNHMPQNGVDDSEVWSTKTGGKTKNMSGGEADWVELTENRPKDQPFFFWFAAYDAHRNWDADVQWKPDLYGSKHDPTDVVVPPYLADTPDTRQDLASYYNEITRFDWFIGQVRDELQRQGALDNTLLMVMADNGRPFPRAKTRVHDSGMKSAFVSHWPNGITQPGSSCDSLVSAIDICPTVLDLAGVEIPEQVQGVSFDQLFANPDDDLRKYAFSEHNWHDYEAHGRSVRREDGWLYIRNARPQYAWQGPADSVRSPSHQDLRKKRDAGELSKAQADVFLAPRPEEEFYRPEDATQTDNLVDRFRQGDGDSAAEGILTELREAMDAWQYATGDTIPKNYSQDYYDRETGGRKQPTGKVPYGRGDIYGDPAGAEREATRINKAGPK